MTRRGLNLQKQVFQNTYNEVEVFVDTWCQEQKQTEKVNVNEKLE